MRHHISLQRLKLGFVWYDSRYRHYKDINHRGHVLDGSDAPCYVVSEELAEEVHDRTQHAFGLTPRPTERQPQHQSRFNGDV